MEFSAAQDAARQLVSDSVLTLPLLTPKQMERIIERRELTISKNLRDSMGRPACPAKSEECRKLIGNYLSEVGFDQLPARVFTPIIDAICAAYSQAARDEYALHMSRKHAATNKND